MARTVEVDFVNVPLVADLFRASHRVLAERLFGGVTIDAWNELLTAHDAIARLNEDEED